MKMCKNVVLVFVLSLSLLSSLPSKAQKSNPLRFGVGANFGTTLKDPTRFVLGADGRLQIPLGNSFSAIATTGYYHFFKNENKGVTEGIGVIPLKAGLKYFPIKNVYIAGEAGAGFFTKGDNNVSFVYSPSAGLAFANGLDISLKYENFTKFDGYTSQLALRLAYGFKL